MATTCRRRRPAAPQRKASPVYRAGSEPPPAQPGFILPFGNRASAAPAAQPATADNDPDAIRPPQPVGGGQQQNVATPPAPAGTAALPPEDQPETGQPKELPANLKRQLVDYQTKEPAGTIIVDTANTYLYLVLGHGKALRYGVRVGREGFTWTGTERISKMKEWPDWFPPPEMIDRQPYLPRIMAGGPGNPLGARAMYLGHTLYRIHGTNQPSTIGHYVSSGCVRHAQRGYRGSLQPRAGRHPRRRAAGQSAGDGVERFGPRRFGKQRQRHGRAGARLRPVRSRDASVTSRALPPVVHRN